MRFIEVNSGFSIPVSNEENTLLEKIEHDGKYPQTKLNEREQELARMLLSRGLLSSIKTDSKTYFKSNRSSDFLRD